MIRVLVGLAVGVIFLMTAAGIAFIVATTPAVLPVGFRLGEFVAYSLIQLSFGAVGAVLADRRPHNPIGWLFLGVATVSAWLQLTSGYALYAIAEARPLAELVAWVYNWSTVGLFATIFPTLVLFPEGRPSSRAGRIGLWLTPSTLLAGVAVAVRPGPLVNMPSVRNPYALSEQDAVYLVVLLLGFPVFFAMMTFLVWDVVSRVRGASGPLRQQMKWFVWSAALVAAAMVLAVVLNLGSLFAPEASHDLESYLSRFFFSIAVSTLPVALGLAVLRYRLYDIDLLIKRTLVYGALSAALVAMYAASVVLLGSLLRPLVGGSEIAVAAATLAAVAAVQPLRRRIQSGVDRRFYRSRYDAGRTLDAFSTRLRDDVDLDSVRGEVLDVVGDTMQPAHAGLWLRGVGR